MTGDTIYINLPQISEVHERQVHLGDIADVRCKNKAVEAKCRAVKVTSFPEKQKGKQDGVFVGSVLDLVETLEAAGSGVQVNNVGEVDFIVKYKPDKMPAMAWEWTKTAFVSAVSFCGAAFAIMTFNNDANVTDVFSKIYGTVMGQEPGGPSILEFSYSLGLAVGILVFFNHFASWKLTADPTPIEVEMRLYEESVNKAVIQNSQRKESGVDVS